MLACILAVQSHLANKMKAETPNGAFKYIAGKVWLRRQQGVERGAPVADAKAKAWSVARTMLLDKARHFNVAMLVLVSMIDNIGYKFFKD